MLVVAGCGEPTSGPTRAAAPRGVSAPNGPTLDYSGGYSYGEQSSAFTVTAQGGSFSINGLFSVNFPANSVCEPTSTYGPSEWDNACATLGPNESIQMQATLWITATGVGVDFSPALRFSPSTVVTISSSVFAPMLTSNESYYQSNPSALQLLAINYSPAIGSSAVADYVSDPSLVTQVDWTTGKLWRRVKHFSGYLIGAGSTCDPTTTICP